jgi:PAS domain S-box-containing protein
MGDWMLLQAGVTFVLAAGLAVYLGFQRPRTHLQAAVLALLLALMLWTGGMLGLGLAPTGGVGARLATSVCFLGVMLAPPVWLFVCARLSGVAVTADRPRAALLALLVPSAVNFALMATDPLHGRFASGRTLDVFVAPALEWAGPFFWLHVLWSYTCVIGGVALCLAAARRSRGNERRQLLLVALAASVPLISVGVLLCGLTTPETHPTPADLGVSAALLVFAVLRYRFLEPSPIGARELLAHLHDGLLLLDVDGAVVDANPAARQILGQPLAGILGRSLAEMVALLDPAEPVALALDPAGEAALPATTLVTRDQRVLDVSAAWARDREGRAQGMLCVLRDRTSQHRIERLRLQSQRLESLGVIAAGIAHEINNPLSFVRTNLAYLTRVAEIVRKHAADFEPAERSELAELEEVVLESIAGVDRIAGIVASTRRLSRRPDPTRGTIDLNHVYREAARLVTFDSGRVGVFEADLEPDLPAAWGSPDQIGQVILNLLINAKQAVRESSPGRVRVVTRSTPQSVELCVHDDGPGVAPEARERIFDPFFTTKTPDEGTGLGLAIAHDVVRAHGGSLELCESELGGACFRMRIPRHDARRADPAAAG